MRKILKNYWKSWKFRVRENKRCAKWIWCAKIRGARKMKFRGCPKIRGAKIRGAKIKGARKFKGIRYAVSRKIEIRKIWPLSGRFKNPWSMRCCTAHWPPWYFRHIWNPTLFVYDWMIFSLGWRKKCKFVICDFSFDERARLVKYISGRDTTNCVFSFFHMEINF